MKLDRSLLVRREYASEDAGCEVGETGGRIRRELGAPVRDPLGFARENGEDVLRPRFPDTESLRRFVASTIDRARLAPQVHEIAEPFHTVARHVLTTARGPR